ncbi:branched-chain amino acid ABC transporter permease [Zeimonas arvi]|jgi:branched-chain amino acid transport system permease protein|uniref:Branched-chain amino acid ABC transporter permease n=1 Tax=Zeimonas arvi TaxID=2498847 RepID=A0A5C8NT49_9BURK|nr:branched-chain amino acid ABC transporter permease [Zeimonas arvi]TXL64182.1 branched-chain amino acid ABC transporter permease [Zeimonas arvi]
MFTRKIDLGGALLFVALMAALPLLFRNAYLTGVLTVAVIYAIWAVSWDFMSGLTGRENFGHSLFIGAGAYTAGFLNTVWGFDGWWSIPAAMIVSSLFALIMGFPTLRLKGPYFALAMLSAAVIMQRLMLIFWEYTGGEEGINGVEPLIESQLGFYYFALAVLVGVTAVLIALARSNWGLILRAIRGDEATCQAAGLNITYYKIASLVISGAVAGAGGAMYAHYQLQVSPALFEVVTSITVITMVYVGGMASIYGPVGGAILLVLLTELLRDFGEWRLMIYSVVLILILFFLPQGFIAPLWERFKARFGRSST